MENQKITNLLDNTSDKVSAIIFIIFSGFLIFYQVLLSPQVKRWAIITYKHEVSLKYFVSYYRFITEKWVDAHYQSGGTYNTKKQIRFKTSM